MENNKFSNYTFFATVLGIASLTIIIFFVFYMELLEYKNEKIDSIEHIKVVLQLFTLVGLAVTIVFTFKRLSIAERQVDTALKQYEVSEKGHYSDRFAKAVEMFSKDDITQKLAGIYTLKEILNRSDNFITYSSITIHLLSSFIRECCKYNSDDIFAINTRQKDEINTLADLRKEVGNWYNKKDHKHLSLISNAISRMDSSKAYNKYYLAINEAFEVISFILSNKKIPPTFNKDALDFTGCIFLKLETNEQTFARLEKFVFRGCIFIYSNIHINISSLNTEFNGSSTLCSYVNGTFTNTDKLREKGIINIPL